MEIHGGRDQGRSGYEWHCPECGTRNFSEKIGDFTLLYCAACEVVIGKFTEPPPMPYFKFPEGFFSDSTKPLGGSR